MQAFARGVVDLGAEPLLQELVNSHELAEAEAARRVGINEYVDVGVSLTRIASHRAEQIEAANATRPDIRFGRPQPRYGFVPTHPFNL